MIEARPNSSALDSEEIQVMMPRLIAGAVGALLLLSAPGWADDPFKSGPPVGAKNNRGGFYPQLVTGPGAGERRENPRK